MKKEYIRGLRGGVVGIWNNRGVFNRYKKRVWRRRWEVSKSSRIEEVRVERKNNGRIQESSKK